MRYVLIVICVLFPFFSVYSADSIVVYRMSDKSQQIWGVFKKSFDSKGYNMSIYDRTDSIDAHLENANRINRTNASLIVALDLSTSEKEDIFIAFTSAKKGRGRFLTIEEVTGQHVDKSMILAKDIAAAFNQNAKEIPLFSLLGVNMPGVFVRIACTNERAEDMFVKLHQGVQNFMKRGQ